MLAGWAPFQQQNQTWTQGLDWPGNEEGQLNMHDNNVFVATIAASTQASDYTLLLSQV